MKTRDNRVFSHAEEESSRMAAEGSQDDELAIICEAHAAEVAKLFEPAYRNRGRHGTTQLK